VRLVGYLKEIYYDVR